MMKRALQEIIKLILLTMMLAWVLLVCRVGVNSFKKKNWFENYPNDCKINLRLTPINSRHVGFLRSDQAYAMISNIRNGSRFNVLCPR